MATINEKMTTLADSIRNKSGIPGALSLDGMIAAVKSIDAIGKRETPYISQIIPAVQLKLEGTVTSTPMGTARLRVIKTLNITHQSRVYVELINMYKDNLPARELTLHGVSFTLKVTTVVVGQPGSQTGNVTISVGELKIPINPTTVNGLSYLVSDEICMPPGTVTPLTKNLVIGLSDPIPNTDVTVEVTSVKFERAVLADENGNIDSVEAVEMGHLPQQVMDPFIFGDTDVSKELAVYADFRAKDPRFNLSGEDWEGALITKNNALTPDDLPNYGGKN